MCGTACDFVTEIAKVQKRDFEHHAEPFIGPLLKIILRANKVFNQRGLSTLQSLIQHSGLISLANILAGELKSANKSYRTSIAQLTGTLLKLTDASVLREHLPNFEKLIREGLSDPESSTRDQSKDNFVLFQELFPYESARFLDTLPTQVSKHLDQRSTQKSVSGHSKSVSNSNAAAKLISTAPKIGETETIAKPDLSAATQSQQQKDHKAVSGKLGALLAQFSERNPSAAASLKFPASLQNVIPKRDVASAASVPSTPRRAKAFLGPVQRIGEPQSVRKLPQPKMIEKQSRKSLPSLDFNEKTESSVLADIFVNDESMKRKSFGTESKTPKKLKCDEEVEKIAEKPGRSVFSPLKDESKTVTFAAAPKTPVRPVAIQEQVVKSRLASPKKIVAHTAETETPQENAVVEPKFDITKAIKETKKSDWSARTDAYQKLYDFIVKNEESKEVSKVLDAFVQGLDDSHFRILKVVLDGWQDVISNFLTDKTAKYLEAILPRLVNISESSQGRTKSGIREQALALVDLVKTRLDGKVFVSQLFNCLNSSEYSNNVRVKHGAIALIADCIADIKIELFGKLSFFKMSLSRLSACIPESDKPVLANILKIMLEMHSVSAHLFFEAISCLSLGDKTRIKSLVSKKIPNYKQMEDEAINVRRGKIRTAGMVKVEVPKSQADTITKSRVPVASKPSVISKTASRPTTSGKFKSEKPSGIAKVSKPAISKSTLSVNKPQNSEPVDLIIVGKKVEIISLEDEDTGSIPSEDLENDEVDDLVIVGKPIYIQEADDDLDPIEEMIDSVENDDSYQQFTSTVSFNDESCAIVSDPKEQTLQKVSIAVEQSVQGIVNDLFIKTVPSTNVSVSHQDYDRVAEELLNECIQRALIIS